MFQPAPLTPSLEAALRDVRARSPEARAAALEVLSEVGPEHRPRAIESARSLLTDPAGIVRVAALVAIGRLRDEDACDAVLARLDDEDPTVREVALISLAELGGERAERAVIAALGSTRPEMRFQAVAAIAALAPDRARGHIVPRLEDPDPEVRAHAAAALASIGDAPGTRRAIGELLEDPIAKVRAEAALALASLGDARAVPQLVHALDDAEHAIEAAEELGRLLDCPTPESAEPSAREALARLARAVRKPLLLKAAASASLARIGDPRGIQGLRAVLGAFRADGRTYAVTAIGELGLDALAPELAALLDRPRGADPIAIVDALAALEAQSETAAIALARARARNDEAGAHARTLEHARADTVARGRSPERRSPRT